MNNTTSWTLRDPINAAYSLAWAMNEVSIFIDDDHKSLNCQHLSIASVKDMMINHFSERRKNACLHDCEAVHPSRCSSNPGAVVHSGAVHTGWCGVHMRVLTAWYSSHRTVQCTHASTLCAIHLTQRTLWTRLCTVECAHATTEYSVRTLLQCTVYSVNTLLQCTVGAHCPNT